MLVHVWVGSIRVVQKNCHQWAELGLQDSARVIINPEAWSPLDEFWVTCDFVTIPGEVVTVLGSFPAGR